MRLSPVLALLAVLVPPIGCASEAHRAGAAPPAEPAASATAASTQVIEAPAASAETARISADDLRGLVADLASDESAGRATGTPEALRAAERIAQALAAAGVRPAGDDGGFLQAIDTVGFRMQTLPRLALIGADGTETEALYGVDFAYLRGPPMSGRFEVVKRTFDIRDRFDCHCFAKEEVLGEFTFG